MAISRWCTWIRLPQVKKPQCVIDTIVHYYKPSNKYIVASMCWAMKAQNFTQSREKIAAFFGAESNEFILTRNMTEGIGFVWMWAEKHIQKVMTDDVDGASQQCGSMAMLAERTG